MYTAGSPFRLSGQARRRRQLRRIITVIASVVAVLVAGLFVAQRISESARLERAIENLGSSESAARRDAIRWLARNDPDALFENIGLLDAALAEDHPNAAEDVRTLHAEILRTYPERIVEIECIEDPPPTISEYGFDALAGACKELVEDGALARVSAAARAILATVHGEGASAATRSRLASGTLSALTQGSPDTLLSTLR